MRCSVQKFVERTQTLSVSSLCSSPAPPRGELYLVAANFSALPKSSPFGRAGAALAVTERVHFPVKAPIPAAHGPQANSSKCSCPERPPPVKKQLWKIRRFSRVAKLKIIFPLKMRRAKRSALKSFTPRQVHCQESTALSSTLSSTASCKAFSILRCAP